MSKGDIVLISCFNSDINLSKTYEGHRLMREYEISLGMHKKAHDPELDPFLIFGKEKIVLFILLIILPIIFTSLTLVLIVFSDQDLILSLVVIISCIFLLIGVAATQRIYRRMRKFRVTGSVIQDLVRLLELFGLRVQSALFPIFFLLLIFSLFSSNADEGNELPITGILQILGLVMVFIGVLLILNSYLNHIDEYNQRVMALDDRTPDEKIRQELKNWGKKLGFKDVKIRLAALPPNYFGKLAIGTTVENSVYLAYSKIAHFQAEGDSSLIYCVRELCWLSLESRFTYYLYYIIHNTLYTLYLALFGLVVFSTTSENSIIHKSLLILCILAVIILMIADSFIKAYISSYALLLELESDVKVVEVLSSEERPSEEIKRTLRLIEKIDPLSTGYPGFKYRRNALMQDTERKTYWDEL
ncbi:hypothetical protein CEE45_03530 [Candidatus Heimdallarchaeota archaeon B3_Heim]|nr:MAG: hypothetical protein CEE45_03530 [Candidatus Heimdallarchaeota archaeon B3_Heim]